MLSIKFIRENLDKIKENMKKKELDVNTVDELLKVDENLRN